MLESQPAVQSGQVVALRLFDVAYEIDLKRAELLWAKHSKGSSTRSQLLATPPKAVAFGVPPLALELESIELDIGGAKVSASTNIRLYDFGIAAVSLRFPVQGLSWPDFTRRTNAINLAVGPAAVTTIWDQILAQSCRLLGDSLRRPTQVPLQEDYLIAIVNGFDEPMTGKSLLERMDLVPLLSGEDRPLSDGARQDILRQSFSYYPDDLAVITWDRAFLYEPQRGTDVADVLEVTNAQLLEMRAYDEMLDAELPRMHDLVEAARRHTNFLASRRYARLARQLYTLVAEVTELAERVDNALQVTEDVYLARVYAAAIGLFRVPNVSAAVDRKLAIIRETYTALHHEAADARAEILELAVLMLIALEVTLSILRH